MQCLRCSNDAVVGKALCAQCLAKNESKLNVEQSEEWVQERLRSTRKNIRKINAEKKPFSEELQSALTKLAPVIVVVFLIVALGPTLFRAKPLPAPTVVPPPASSDGKDGVLGGDTGTSSRNGAESIQRESDGGNGSHDSGEEGRSPEAYPTIDPSIAAPTEIPTATPTNTPTATPTETPTITPG